MEAAKLNSVVLKKLIDGQFMPAFARVMQGAMPFPLAMRLKRTIKAVKSEVEHYGELRQDVLKRFGKLTETGDLFLRDGQWVEFETPEKKAECDKELKALEEVMLALPAPVKFRELGEKWSGSPDDLAVLDGIVFEE